MLGVPTAFAHSLSLTCFPAPSSHCPSPVCFHSSCHQFLSRTTELHTDLLRLIATANAPIIGIDDRMCVNEWNQKAVSLTGFSRDEVMGRLLIDEFIEPAAQDSVRGVLSGALRGAPRDNYQFTLMTKSKQPLQILLNATPRFNTVGRIVGVIGIGQDVSKELAQQADLLRLIASANAPIIGIDAGYRVNEWNEKAVSLTGFTRDEVMGRPLVEEFIEPQTQASVRSVLENALKGEPTDAYEFTLMTKDRQPLQMLLNATPRYTGLHNAVVGVIGIGQDISKQIADRKLLVQSQKRGAQIWEMLGRGVAIAQMDMWEEDDDSILANTSPGMADMLGFAPTSPRMFYSVEDLARLPHQLIKMRESEIGYRLTETVTLQNVGRAQQTMMKISNDRVACVFTPLEGALQETRIRESRDDMRYLQLLEKEAAELRNGRVQAEEVRDGEAVSETLERLRRYDDTSKSTLTQIAEKEQVQLLASESEGGAQKRQDTLTTLMDSVMLRYRANNAASYERIRIEDVHRAKDQAMLRKTQFDNHEIRGLMQNLLAFITLSETLTDLERGDMGGIIDSVVDVMSNSLLVQSMQSGGYVVTLSPTSVQHFVGQIRQRFSVLCKAKERPCEFNINIDDLMPKWIMIDAESILRCCMNYVTNAIKFAKTLSISIDIGHIDIAEGGGPISYEGSSRGGSSEDGTVESGSTTGSEDGPRWQFKFEVRDDGAGIDEEDLELVWLPFRQTRCGRSQGKEGTGLGLPITMGTVQAHPGGEVGCRSTKGSGSCFWFVLDAVEAPPAEITTMLGDKPTIMALLVDDDPIVRRAVAGFAISGIHWHVVSGFAEAIAAVEDGEQKFDIALIDYHLSGEEGAERGTDLIRILRELRPELVCVGGTSDPTELVQFEYKAAGGVDVIQKPYYAFDLGQALKRLVSQHTPKEVARRLGDPTDVRILIVDDSPMVLRMMPVVFKVESKSINFGSCVSETRDSGESALELLERGTRFDAAIVDFNMGSENLTGAQTMRKLRQIDPDMMCFGVTGNGDEKGVMSKFIAAGAVKVYTKPFAGKSARAILAQVRKKQGHFFPPLRIVDDGESASSESSPLLASPDDDEMRMRIEARSAEGVSHHIDTGGESEGSMEESNGTTVSCSFSSSSGEFQMGDIDFVDVRERLFDMYGDEYIDIMMSCLKEVKDEMRTMNDRPTQDKAHKLKGAMMQLQLDAMGTLTKLMENSLGEDENFDVSELMQQFEVLYTQVVVEFEEEAKQIKEAGGGMPRGGLTPVFVDAISPLQTNGHIIVEGGHVYAATNYSEALIPS